MWFWLICLIVYLICSLWFLASSLIQLQLLFKSRNTQSREIGFQNLEHLPSVTIQVPVFNERFVIARLLENLGAMDYPISLFEIQVLDDSTDDTTSIIAESCGKLTNAGMTVSILTRTERTGYKAGALQAGLPFCRGELIAIFDADFTPAPDFLKRIVRHFQNPSVAGVQCRWQHRNLRENWLTTIQSYLLDSHFTIEQQGRNAAGYLVNFNGTAGMWRKACIETAGGWNGNVLTEDLELSYRTQLKGWKLIYDNSIAVAADLPVEMEAFKAQQFRWAKGMAQVATKHLRSVLKAPIPFLKKMHGLFHLMGSATFPAVLGNMLLAMPLVIGRHMSSGFNHYTQLIIATAITIPIICSYYYAGTQASLSRREFWLNLPVFLVVYMALSVQNTVAVIQGWIGLASPFVRTPKPDISHKLYDDDIVKWTRINTLELLVFLYLVTTIMMSFIWKDYFLLLFLVMGATGLWLLLQPAISRTFKKPSRAAETGVQFT